jgi:hypothetical protein
MLSIVIQSVIVIALSLAVGARLHNGVAGVIVLVAVAGLLGRSSPRSRTASPC